MSTQRSPAGVTVWLTGLSGAGKSTIAAAAVDALRAHGVSASILDGDVLRGGLFSAEDRAEAVRRAGEAAILLASSGVTAVAALISPYRADRDRVRARHAEAGVAFIEVFVDAPLEVAERRDPKGLYAKARAGHIPAFTGISDPYEPPLAAELRLATAEMRKEDCVDAVVAAVRSAATSR
jgi:bifunctional enzyme CysN/CysC